MNEITVDYYRRATEKLDHLAKPIGSLGRLESLAARLSAIYKTLEPRVNGKALIVMCADNHVVEEGVAAAPQVVTLLQSKNIAEGRSAVGVMAATAGAKTYTVDIGINASQDQIPDSIISRKIRYGAGNIRKEPAMTREEAKRAIEIGREIAERAICEGANLLAVGEMGIGNTTPATAITAVYGGLSPSEIVGIGANLPEALLPNKARVISDAIALHQPNPNDALDVLSKVGSLEIGGMAGVMLAGLANNVPVILDGYISTAAALIAKGMNEDVVRILVPSHASREKGARTAENLLGIQPYFDLEMRLGEGSGAVLSFALCEQACNILCNMISFDECGIDKV